MQSQYWSLKILSCEDIVTGDIFTLVLEIFNRYSSSDEHERLRDLLHLRPLDKYRDYAHLSIVSVM